MSWIPDTFFAEGLPIESEKDESCNFGLKECVCPICKKRYSRTAEHAWRLSTNKKVRFFCSYSCMRTVEKVEQEKTRIAREAAFRRDMELLAAEEKRRKEKARMKMGAEERKEYEAARRRIKYMDEHPNCRTRRPSA